MPPLLPSDIMNGLNQVNVLNPIQAAQARAVLEQTQLRNQGIPAENERTVLENKGIPARNQQTELQNIGLGLHNSQTEKSMPDILAQLGLKTQGDQADLPGKQLEGDKNTYRKKTFDEAIAPQAAPSPQPEMNGQGPLMSLMNPAPQPAAAQAAPAGTLLDRLKGMDLNGLRDMKMKDQQTGDALKEFLDPALAMKTMADKKLMYDDLNSPEWKDKISAIGTKNTNAITAFNGFRATHPVISLLPESEQAKIQSESFKANAQPNMASMMMAPAAPGASSFWGEGLAARKFTLDQFNQAANGMRGPNKEKFIQDTFSKWAEVDPAFNPSDAAIGIKQAQDKNNNRTLGLIQSVRPNLTRLVELSDKIARSNIKMVSKAELAGNREFSNDDLAKFDALKTLSVDEINNIFSPGGGSNQSREMAMGLVRETLPPKQFKHALNVVIEAMDNRAKGIESLSRGYAGPHVKIEGDVKPLKEWKDGDTRINSAGTPMIRVGGEWKPQ